MGGGVKRGNLAVGKRFSSRSGDGGGDNFTARPIVLQYTYSPNISHFPLMPSLRFDGYGQWNNTFCFEFTFLWHFGKKNRGCYIGFSTLQTACSCPWTIFILRNGLINENQGILGSLDKEKTSLR